ncbi:MAG: ribonuclease III [Fimbriimonadaceae bacterium]
MSVIPSILPLKDEALFRLALRHSSAAPDVVRDSYERLEFFGDSVLGIIVAQYLYEHHPDWDQGMMSKARSSVVQEGPLAEAALRLGLDKHLELSQSEENSGARTRPAVLCDIFEAVVGAIYVEGGLEKARWFVLEQLQPFLEQVSGGDVSPHDHKSRLQEFAQSMWRKTPQYRVAREGGASHERRFTVEVLFDQEVFGEGVGRSKREAEQAAAKDALDTIDRALQRKGEATDLAFDAPGSRS